VQVGDLVKLAKWCKNGPELMQVTNISCRYYVEALFLGGPKLGSIVNVSTGNIFTLEGYDEAMRKHYEGR
jgi:hypothetical protein